MYVPTFNFNLYAISDCNLNNESVTDLINARFLLA